MCIHHSISMQSAFVEFRQSHYIYSFSGLDDGFSYACFFVVARATFPFTGDREKCRLNISPQISAYACYVRICNYFLLDLVCKCHMLYICVIVLGSTLN